MEMQLLSCHKEELTYKSQSSLVEDKWWGVGPCLNVTLKDTADMQKLEDGPNIRIERKTPKNVTLPPLAISISGVNVSKSRTE